jgi:hypothetical protein
VEVINILLRDRHMIYRGEPYHQEEAPLVRSMTEDPTGPRGRVDGVVFADATNGFRERFSV